MGRRFQKISKHLNLRCDYETGGTLFIEKGATKNSISLTAFGPTMSEAETQILLRHMFPFLFITEVLHSGSQTSRPSAPSGTDMCLPVFLSLYHSMCDELVCQLLDRKQ